MTFFSAKFSVNTHQIVFKHLLALACFLSMPLSMLHAQEKDSPQWYQVELFVFAHTNNANAQMEQWPSDLGLKYPEHILTLLTDAKSLTANTTATHSLETTSKKQTEQDFLLLDPAQHQLARAAKKILAQSDFKLLFHGAWRQVIGKRTQSASLAIHGGDAYDQHFELEGSINLSVERYLHIKTDLWLSTFARNSADDQQMWPVLPKRPLRLVNAVLDPNSAPRSNAYTTANNNSLGESLQQSLQTQYKRLIDNPFDELRNNQYVVKQTVVMRQQRRMRSNELHYIDHPMMGLLVKITPYDLSTGTLKQ